MSNCTERLRRLIDTNGPIPLSHFMAEANAEYYATRDPFGSEGDFITAPEISQMFGELTGLWLTDMWSRAGSPAKAHYVELGPGRGTLAEDAIRAMQSVRFQPPIHLVETSPVLRKSLASRLPNARWHDDLDSLPESGPLFVVANEFFDALPIRQLVREQAGWFEVMIANAGETFQRATSGPPLDTLVPETLRNSPIGSVIETSPAIESVARALATKIAAHGGTALIIDYGYMGPATGDTLQAVKNHDYANPLTAPGERDLTAHVDFNTLDRIGKQHGLSVFGPTDQGRWLESLGIGARSMALTKASPNRQKELAEARNRLTSPQEMGILFKVMAWVAPEWPHPAAF